MSELLFLTAVIVSASPLIVGLGLAFWGMRRWKHGRKWGKWMTFAPIGLLLAVPLSGFVVNTTRDKAVREYLITPDPQSLEPGRVLAISLYGGVCQELCYFLESTGLASDVVVTSADDFGWRPSARDTRLDLKTTQVFRGTPAGDGINYVLEGLPLSENDKIKYVYLNAPLSELAKIDPAKWQDVAALDLRFGRGLVLFDVSGKASFDLLTSPVVLQRAGGMSTYQAFPIIFFGEQSDFVPLDLSPRAVLETAVKRSN